MLFLLVFGFAATSAFAQVAKYGKVNEAELKMTRFAQDTSAEAIVLSDYGYTRFSFNHEVQVITERHIRIKILKKSGYDWATIDVPFYVKGGDRERVSSIKGVTYNLENGQVQKSKLESGAVFEEQHSENWFSKKFTMPNVKEGSVIDVAYTITSDFVYNLREWEFQTTIPTLWSEYHAEIPSYYDYKFLMQGYHPLYSNDKNIAASAKPELVNNAYVWIMKDVPALKEEKYITTIKDYQSRIEFELQQIVYPGQAARQMSGNWDDVTSDLMMSERFGAQLNRSGFFKSEVAYTMNQHKTPLQLAQALYDQVKSRMNWNGKYTYLATTTTRKAYETRTGNVADINLLLTAMLQEAGLEASPVLVSTRENGRPPKQSPLVNKFNYVVCHVEIDGVSYLLDATEPLMPFGMLPVRALNGEGYLIKKKEHRWVALKPVVYSKFITTDLALKANGDMDGQATESAGGYYAFSVRKSLSDNGEEKFSESLKRGANYKVGKPMIENKDKLTEALKIKYSISASGNGQDNHIIYLSPLVGHAKTDNPFKVSERVYPVDFGTPVDETIITNYTIPTGYVIDEAPKNVTVSLPNNGGKFTYLVQQEGNTLQVLSRININKPVFYAQEYAYLKEFYNQIIAKHAEQIVLKKGTAN
ncbi:transglutaminase domain-containing protein [Pontibacter fetidus]|uniref:DUF3857 domain-containing protein n=1 Tax=Pontibacter fetidus TaxID=2700082 RepID=A0A6B2H5T3_9BACT|nr:transglutaminase domain-containing protein [Pontibacter fetidus]NDK55170.1 DUF3857 domain-containing protein [Pontibacter fetidus]